jgi:organic radical activating enzyme
MLTEKCSLKCKDCGNLMPHFKQPRHYEEESIAESMKRLSESVDGIRNLVLFGGEPFIHPEFVDICRVAAEIDNALMITVITNGTIIPADEVLQQIHDLGICVQISDYGEPSNKRVALEERLNEKQIVCEVVPQTAVWYPVSAPENHHRSRQERIELFEKCVFSKKCPQLQNGEFHICGYSAAGSALSLIPKDGSGYVDLLDKTLSTDEIRKKVNYLLNEVKEITACGYCGFDFMSTTVRAAQLREK